MRRKSLIKATGAVAGLVAIPGGKVAAAVTHVYPVLPQKDSLVNQVAFKPLDQTDP